MSAEPRVTPGVYRHFKGDRYEVIDTARHSETEELLVVYRAVSGSGGLWVRPAAMFTELVEVDGQPVARFQLIHRVFSYGTLRLPQVQRTLYGREVPTVADQLPGHRLDWLLITDPEVVRTSGSDRHPILHRGESHDVVDGAYLELTERELAATDEYEVDDYERRAVVLASGLDAWAYLAPDSDA